MSQGMPDPKELGRLFAFAQVGFEMAAPVGIGMALDYYLDWRPWGTVGGAIVGLVGGIFHLVVLSNRQTDDRRKPPTREPQ